MYIVGYVSTAISGSIMRPFIERKLKVPIFSFIGTDPLQDYVGLIYSHTGSKIFSMDRKGMDRNFQLAAT